LSHKKLYSSEIKKVYVPEIVFMRKFPSWSKLLMTSATSLLVLTGCGGVSPVPSQNLGVANLNISTSNVPSLGMVRNATVRITNAAGRSILGASGELSNTGSVFLTYLANTPGPLIVEVLGYDDAECFDESTGTFCLFQLGQAFGRSWHSPKQLLVSLR
jgi:hypothetical protein